MTPISIVRTAALMALAGHVAAFAADGQTLVSGSNVTVTSSDLASDAQRMPAESRKGILSKPENVSQAASNMYVRRVLAAEAEKNGLDKNPMVAAAMQIARDRVLSDARLAELDAAGRPTDAALEEYARGKYKADPQRFSTPDQTRARHILIGNQGPDAKEKAAEKKAKAEKLLQELKNGADFEALAKQNSDDPGSAVKGGDLGFFAKGKMVKPFEDAVGQLQKAGDLSSVVETQFGFHIIRLEERRPAMKRPFEEVKEELYREALNKILTDARIHKVDKILVDAKFDKAAIDAFAEAQK